MGSTALQVVRDGGEDAMNEPSSDEAERIEQLERQVDRQAVVLNKVVSLLRTSSGATIELLDGCESLMQAR